MKICCLIPTYNRPKFLANAVNQFHAQTWQEKDALILADTEGISVDASGTTMLIWPGRNYSGYKRNEGIRARADAEFFCHWDDDDWSGPRRLEILANALGDADVVAFKRDWVLDAKTGKFYRTNYDKNPFLYGTVLYRRKVWEDFKGFNDHLRIAQSYEMFERAATGGAKIKVVPDEGSFVYVRHPFQTVVNYPRRDEMTETGRPEFFPESDLQVLMEAARGG